MIAQLAVIVYGVLAIIAALVLSSQVGSPVATALAFTAAALTYLFQVLQDQDGVRPAILLALWAGVIVALLASVIVSLGSVS